MAIVSMPATYRKDGDYYVSTRLHVMNKPGRRVKLTPQLRAQLLALVRLGYGRRACATQCGISVKSLRRWMDADFSFAADIARAERAASELSDLLNAAW